MVAQRAPEDVARASWAVGFSAAAGFRDVVPVAPEALRRGVRDGLAGGMTTTTVMQRAETFDRIRGVLKRLSDAELATIAARVDAAQDY